MKALLINGSPRPNGCTFTALTELANTLEAEGIETEIVHVGNKDIRGCIACRRCCGPLPVSIYRWRWISSSSIRKWPMKRSSTAAPNWR